MEKNIDALLDMSFNAQRVVDRKTDEIKRLEMQRMQYSADKGNYGNNRNWFRE